MQKNYRIFIFLFLLIGVQAHASVYLVQNIKKFTFTQAGQKYHINPQRFHALCDNGYCSFKTMGRTFTVPQINFNLLSRANVRPSSIINNYSPSRTEAGTSEECTNCQSQSSLSDLSTQVSNSGFLTPVNGVLTSKYGWRIHPLDGRRKFHQGIDLGAPARTKVVASKAGKILKIVSGCKSSSCGGGYGNYVLIDHGDGTKTRYAHLHGSCPLPKVGTTVSQGQKIGCVGKTGKTTGNHLHFEILINDKSVDPLKYIKRS